MFGVQLLDATDLWQSVKKKVQRARGKDPHALGVYECFMYETYMHKVLLPRPLVAYANT